MKRPLCAVSLLAVVSLLAAACSGAAEQAVIGQFFNASRLRDNTALERFATVIFDPRTRGTVTRFTVDAIGSEARKPLTPNLDAQLVERSLNAARSATEVISYEGELASKDVTVSAPVRLPDGSTARKTYIITLQRATLKGEPPITGHWIVTGIRDPQSTIRH